MNDFTIQFNQLKDGVLEFSIKSEDFFNNLKKNIQNSLRNLKKKFKEMIFGEKEEKNIKLAKKLLKKYKFLDKKLTKIQDSTSATKDLAIQIKEDTSQIILDINEVSIIVEMIMNQVDDVEDYMKRNLGSDWKKIKNYWKKYKNNEITKGEFIKFGLKNIGKRFLGIFVRVSN